MQKKYFKQLLPLKNDEQYKACQKYVDSAKKEIDKVNGWLDPKYKTWTDRYEQLAILLLNYEVENNLLPI